MIGYKYLEENNLDVNGVIHVGAHRGEEINEHLALGAKKIIWIEANPDVFEELLENIGGDTRADNYFFNNLCSDTNDDLKDFHIVYGPDAGHMVGNKGCSSMLSPIGRFESWEREKIVIPTIKLDTLFKLHEFNMSEFDFLEIDTQGAELYVLGGAEEVLKNIKYASIEVTYSNPDYDNGPLAEDIIGFMNDAGFDYIETKFLDTNWGDALFIRRD